MRVLMFDASETSFVGQSWAIGSKVFQGQFDKVFPVRTTGDVYQAISDLPAESVAELQFWSHGAVGQAVVNRENLNFELPVWSALRGGRVWFRTCLTLAGRNGHRLAVRLGRQGIDVAGHLGVIGTWGVHSHLVALRAGETPWWSERVYGNSAPWEPRTTTALAMHLPKWAYRPEPAV